MKIRTTETTRQAMIAIMSRMSSQVGIFFFFFWTTGSWVGYAG
jgi:hypothetical protein